MRNLLLLCGLSAIAAWAQPITACGTTINAPGSYYLTGNLTCTGTTSGVVVAADNVTIDLRGFVLTGPGSRAGITNMDAAGLCTIVPRYLTVTGGRISNWLVAVQLCAPQGPASFSRANLHHLTISGNGTGIILNNITNATISSNTVESNSLPIGQVRVGIYVQDGALHSISSNTVRFNALGGIVVNSGSEHWVGGNTVQNNGSHGVKLATGASSTTVYRNVSFGHTVYDLMDETIGCGTNSWSADGYGTRNQRCVN